MIRNKSILAKFAELHPYFWNAFFTIIYEPYRKSKPVAPSSVQPSFAENIFTSKSTLFDYLRFKRPLSEDDCIEYCKGLKINIFDNSFDAISVGNSALAYLQMYYDNKPSKLFSSSRYRSKKIEQLIGNNNEDFFENTTEKNLNAFEQEIIDIFSELSEQDIAYLYAIAEVLSYLSIYDFDFLSFYTELNTSGRKLFKEALSLNFTDNTGISEDESIQIFRRLSLIAKENIPSSVTPKMLADKLGYISRYSPEYANFLCLFQRMDEDTWNILIEFHCKISVLGNDTISDYPISEKESLIVFLNWLWNLPSLRLA